MTGVRARLFLVSVRDELVTILETSGRLMASTELAAAFRVRRGSSDPSPDRALAKSMTVVSAAVLAETRGAADDHEPRLNLTRRSGRILISLESLPGTDDPSPSELADYALELGARADTLVSADALPGKSEVMRELRAAKAPEGLPPLAETRLISLAASVSANALASPRLDLYPRGLDLVRALRVSQAAAGARHEKGLTVDDLLARLQAWFPELDALTSPSTYLDLEDPLREAGFQLAYDSRSLEFRPPAPTRQYSSTGTGLYTAGLSESAGLVRTPGDKIGSRLATALAEGGFLALTLDQKTLPGAADLLQATYPVTKINLADVFLTEMRGLAGEHGADWAQLLHADEKLTRTLTMPAGLRSYVTLGWQRTTGAVIARASAPRTILLVHNAGLLARYHDDGGHTCLVTLQQAARLPDSSPYGLWLLCPSEAPKTTGPNLDGRTVEAIDASEWSVLDRKFLDSLRQAA